MRRRWLRSVLLLLAGLAVASSGLSLALRAGWARRALLTRLAAGFGRPVEVGRFGFNLLNGLRLEAQSITVAEDPRFGQEYFLRAERLSAGVRWTALLRGRFEFDTVSLTQPSLNLVRLADGQWNIESWLPPLRPAFVTALGAAPPAVSPRSAAIAARISRIEVVGGRINFKRESRKLSLALVGVRGQLNQDDEGHWHVDLQADPMRAPAALQEAGTLSVRGVVGGVSARLRPAELSVAWENASLADLSRLLAGRDYGLRGTLDAELSAQIVDDPAASAPVGGKWLVDGTVRLQGVHGWALAGRASDPNANVNIQALWTPAASRLFISRCLVEAPQSQLTATMDLDWSRGFRPSAEVTSSRVALADVLAWRRALVAGVADDLSVEGAVDAEGSLSGWPLRIEDLSLASEGAVIRSATLPEPIRVGPVSTEWANASLKLHSVSVSLPAPPPATARSARNPQAGGPVLPSSILRVEGALGPISAIDELHEARYRVAISGSTGRAQDLLALARAWGWSAGSTWSAEGPVSLQLAWTGLLRRGTSAVSGTIQARNLKLSTPLLNEPLLVSSAGIALRPGLRQIDLEAVQALGARWTGSLRNSAAGAPWDFDLSADHLNTADLNAWLASPDHPSLFRRMLPFGAATASAGEVSRADALGHLRASGRLRVGELVLSPVEVEQVDAQAVIDGPSVVLRQGHADFYGGQLTGGFEAVLSAEPSFSFDGRVARVDLRDLAAAASLPGQVTGLATGDLKLAARGSDRAALVASLQGQGQMRIREAQLGQIELIPAAAGPAEELDTGIGSLPFTATARFQVGAGQVRLDQFQIARPDEQVQITGIVDFARRIDLRVQVLPRSIPTAAALNGDADTWNVVGTLDSPRIASPPVAASPPSIRAGAGNGLPIARR